MRLLRSLVLAVVGFTVVVFGGWFLAFRTLDSCQAMREQVERVASASGADGPLIRQSLLGKNEATAPLQCAQLALALRVRGRSAIVVVGPK